MERAFSSPYPFGRISKSKIDSLLKLNFDGVGLTFSFDHFYRFNHSCIYFEVSNGYEVCRLFTLKLERRIRGWFKAFSSKSIHSWKQFIELFLISYQNYDYNELFLELENIYK